MEDPGGYYSTSPNLMTSWKGGIAADRISILGLYVKGINFCPPLSAINIKLGQRL
jgi:hypothetical protein